MERAKPTMGRVRENAAAFTVLAVLALLTPTFANSQSPFIVAHKKVTLTKPNPNIQRVSVSIDVYIHGSTPAYDVTVTDESWDAAIFDLYQGNTSKSWSKLDVGSLVTLSFELGSKVKGTYYSAPAVITFRIPERSAFQEAYSTSIMPVHILTEETKEKKLELLKKFWFNYGSQVSVVAVIALFAHIIKSPPKSTASKGSKKRK